MPAGNDLVCLNEINTATFSRKGAAKVMLSSEEISRYGDPGAFMLMKLWAVKEAAYKYFCKKGNRTPFHPADYIVSFFNDGKSGEVCFGSSQCRFLLTLTDRYIHAVCSSVPGEYRVAVGSEEDPLLFLLTGNTDAKVKKDSDGIPFLYINGKPVADISKSDDEGLLAFVMHDDGG